MLDVRGQPPAPPSRTTILAVRGGQSVCFGRRAQAAWVVGGGRGVCFDEQGCPLPRARAALRGLPLVPKAGLKSVNRDVPAARGRGRALAVTTRVLAGFPRPRSLAAERSPSCSRGGILCLRQLLKWLCHWSRSRNIAICCYQLLTTSVVAGRPLAWPRRFPSSVQ